MKRYIANYTIVPHRGIFINHIVTLDDNGFLIGLKPACEELAYTIYVPGTIVLIPEKYAEKYQPLFEASISRNEIFERLTHALQSTEMETLPLTVLRLSASSTY